MRVKIVAAALTLVLLVLAFGALALPGAGMSLAKAWGALVGTELGLARTIVLQWRAPRVFIAIIVGAALAVSGSLFQALTRNPLGSPDIIGFSSGAYTGVICAIVLGYSGFSGQILGALAGGLATAVIVLALSLRTRIDGLRIILVGLGLSAMLSAFNRWLITRGELEAMMSAASWGAGSLNGIRWPVALPAGSCLALVLVGALLLRRQLDVLALGDDTAHGLGLNVNRFKVLLLVVGIVLIAATTAVAGPISFVALAAPHVAQGLNRANRTPLWTTALVGSCLLLAADIIAQRAFHPTTLPVGLVTVVIGGCYLLCFIATSARKFS
ncbi:FecCD family ABC transporter permease [Corynebacterium epidermidicanis]|uniref:ABC-type enterobactin transport system, permease component n=1 Tax=Corynebacterium epidermidicanis TaxID=1050174 RepID=A0A0G3GQZ0_9CORY|nr:iron chelate uptake ABC transporter family permease subunit [Corynebacterium epidermidicanis]AKK01988.1 ABC-type enterobactin transport system, permease component [Corynebacterium epidermidicanis]